MVSAWDAEAGAEAGADADRQPLLDIEEPLRALDIAASLLGHLAVSERTIEGNDLDAHQCNGGHRA